MSVSSAIGPFAILVALTALIGVLIVMRQQSALAILMCRMSRLFERQQQIVGALVPPVSYPSDRPIESRDPNCCSFESKVSSSQSQPMKAEVQSFPV